MPEQAVAKILRAKFRDALKETPELYNQVPAKVWHTDWVVNIKPVGKGKSALKYLAPYIFRVALSNKRIIKFEAGKVTFTYQDNKGQWRKLTLPAEKFISRFLQHVLPYRFVKVRYYGFFSPRKRQAFDSIKELFDGFESNDDRNSGTSLDAEAQIRRCPKCGGEMVFVREIKPQRWRAPPWMVD